MGGAAMINRIKQGRIAKVKKSKRPFLFCGGTYQQEGFYME